MRVSIQSAFVIAGVLAVLSGRSAAQPGDAVPRALTPTTVSDADYPFAALLADEQGRVGLNLAIGRDGRVTDAQVARSSGSQRLDQTAAMIARSRWRFQPAMRNGQAVPATIPVEVVWTTPLRAVANNQIALQPLPNGAQPPRAARPPSAAGDYPSLSMARGEQGVVGVRYLVREDGSIGDAQLASSSGFSRLDNAAMRVVREGWRFEPARVNGMPVQAWRGSLIAYALVPANSYRTRLRCYTQPTLAQDSVLIGGEQDFAFHSQLDLERIMVWRVRPIGGWTALWIRVSETGVVDDALIETTAGWRQLPTALIGKLIEGRVYTPPEREGACWYYDPVAITG